MKKTTECSMSKQAMIFDLEQGLAAEYRALDLCQFIIKLLPDKGDQEIIAKIIKDEQRHIKVVGDLKNDIINFYQS
jgi:hypothetical protein